MSRTRARQLTLAASLVVLVVAVALGWSKQRGYTYQGKTAEEWFAEYNASYRPTNAALTPECLWQPEASLAFHAMGTNAAPFLAMRIMDSERSRLEQWRWALPRPFHPKPHRVSDATRASALLAHCVECPREMLRELLKPALSGTNDFERMCAMYATNSYFTNSLGSYEARVNAQ
jgi:hypothetical protein